MYQHPLVIQPSLVALSLLLVFFCRLRVHKIISAKSCDPAVDAEGPMSKVSKENSCKEDLSSQFPVFFVFQSFKNHVYPVCRRGSRVLRREAASSKLTPRKSY